MEIRVKTRVGDWCGKFGQRLPSSITDYQFNSLSLSATFFKFLVVIRCKMIDITKYKVYCVYCTMRSEYK